MTGFARASGQDETASWAWEARSVNGRSLDLRVRVPSGWEALDPLARAAAGRLFRRGSITLALDVRRSATVSEMQVNEAFLADLIALCAAPRPGAGSAKPRIDTLLTVRGVVEPVQKAGADEAHRNEAVMETLAAALDGLDAARKDEGGRLHDVMIDHLVQMASLAEAASQSAAAQPEALSQRLRRQVEELLSASPALDENRLAQEAALLATKADVREEIDRLKAHVSAANALIEEEGAAGRKLEFLCQELNREANTLCSKATDIELTRIGLDLKSTIDQFREQVQNIE